MQLKAFIRQKYILFTASLFPPIQHKMLSEKREVAYNMIILLDRKTETVIKYERMSRNLK